MSTLRRPLLALAALVAAGCSDYVLTENPGTGETGDDDDDTTPSPDDDTTPVEKPDPDTGELIPQDCHTDSSTVGTFDPVVEWHWEHVSSYPQYSYVIATPIVTHLTDDNGDGSYDQDDMPSIVVPVGPAGAAGTYGGLVALRGDDGSELWAYTGSDVEGYAPVAAGDLDGDGDIELVAGMTGKKLAIFDHLGVKQATSAALNSAYSYCPVPALADLDMDGTPEIIAGRNVLNADLSVRWQKASGGEGGNYWAAISAVADVSGDGEPDVVAGNTAYTADGTLLWTAGGGVPDGFPAIGDFDLDGVADVVLVSAARVYLIRGDTGEKVWGPTPVDGNGGAPTVADVDADGYPEIGVAGSAWFWCLETDGGLKWKVAQQDYSSSATGSSVFDFEGDGAAELIYGDEVRVRIYDGVTGSIRYEITNPNGTAWENPTIADVDSDGHAEMVIVAFPYLDATTGVRVIGDLNDSWVPTRSVWNQHTYHITNTEEDGEIPLYEDNSWEVHNSYRLNQLGSGGSYSVPLADLVVMDIDADPAGCPSEVLLEVQVGNQGETSAPAGVPVALYRGSQPLLSQLIDVKSTTLTLDPMGSEWITFVLAMGDLHGETNITVVVDDTGASTGIVQECNEKNNLGIETASWCD